MNQKDKARKFKELHVKGQPVLLYDAWDVGSAKAFAQAGAEAIATSNWAIAAALGYADEGMVPRQIVTEITAGIVEAVDLPVSVDFHGGYSENDDELARNVSRLLHVGAVGINFEDRILGRSGPRPMDQQANRISVIREAAERMGIDLFINAKTDLFLGRRDGHEKRINETFERANMYAIAGASGLFVPGLWQEHLIEQVCAQVSLPVNVLHGDGVPSNSRLASIGVARISYGDAPYLRAMEAFQRVATEILS